MSYPAYESPIDPATGEILGSSQINLWVRNALYLHGLAAGGFEPFTGIRWKNDSVSGEIRRWYFIYRGVKKLYNNFSGSLSSVAVQHDSGTLSFSPAYANPLDLSAGTFTVGNKYYVALTASAGNITQCDYLYIPSGATAGAWAAPSTLTDGTLSGPTDFSTITTAEAYLKAALEVPRGTFAGISFTVSAGATNYLFNGSFVYNGLNTLNITGTANGVTAVEIHVVDLSGANDRTAYSGSPAGALPSTVDLSGLSPALAVGTRYRLYITVLSASADTVSLKRLYFSGTKALTNNPSLWSVRDYLLASTGANRLDYIRTALNTIQTLFPVQSVSGIDYGLQDLTPDNSAVATTLGITLNAFTDFRRTRRHRWLFYKPTGVGASGSLTYGTTGTSSLPDTAGDASWQVFDLDTIPLCPPGYTYKVTGVSACLESPTSS